MQNLNGIFKRRLNWCYFSKMSAIIYTEDKKLQCVAKYTHCVFSDKEVFKIQFYIFSQRLTNLLAAENRERKSIAAVVKNHI